MASREKFALVLQAEAWSTPAVIRLRRALKLLLRSFGLRCLDVREVKPDAPGERHDAIPTPDGPQAG
jgi:hypothetical protein